MRRSHPWGVLVVTALLAGALAVPAGTAAAVAPAGSPTASVGVVAPAVELARIRRRAVITFDKNPASPSRSTVTWKVVRQGSDGVWRVLEKRSWRAGSGMLGRTGRDACAKNRGWLPNGTYRMRYHRDYHGNLIKGRAFRLDDKRCRNGRMRVELFLHTEQGARNTQCPDRAGDQVCRWEHPRINDYKSAGCVKMSPSDLGELSRRFLRFYKAGVRYSKARVVFRVVS